MVKRKTIRAAFFESFYGFIDPHYSKIDIDWPYLESKFPQQQLRASQVSARSVLHKKFLEKWTLLLVEKLLSNIRNKRLRFYCRVWFLCYKTMALFTHNSLSSLAHFTCFDYFGIYRLSRMLLRVSFLGSAIGTFPTVFMLENLLISRPNAWVEW